MMGQLAVSRELSIFLYACGFGACIGLFYDFFRIMRIAIPFGSLVIFIQDAIFWVVAGAGTFLFTYALNAGEVRGFLLMGELVGAVLYFLTVSRLIIGISDFIIRTVKKLLRLFFTLFIKPFIWLFGKISAAFVIARKKSSKISKKVCQKAKYSLKEMGTLVYNLKVKKSHKPKSGLDGR